MEIVGVGKIYTGNTLLKTVKIISAENIEKNWCGIQYKEINKSMVKTCRLGEK